MPLTAELTPRVLSCFAGHHEPLLVVGRDGTRTPMVLTLSVDGVPMVEQRFCVHCRLSYWHELTIARLVPPGGGSL